MHDDGGGVSPAGIITTWVVHGLLVLFIIGHSSDHGFLGCGGSSDGPKLAHGEEIMIEAAIAYKKPEEKKQPQKRRNKKKAKKKVTISRDADKKPEEKKDDKKEEELPSWEDFKREPTEEPDNPDLEDGEESPKTGGSFDGETYGWADENKGHPYMQQIARYVRFEIPTLEKGKGEAYACIRLADDGKITDTKVRKSGNTNIDRAADEALRRLEEQRNNDKDLEPVPSELRSLTSHWICFKPTG